MREDSWQPEASLQIWKNRMDLIRGIRSFFYDRQVLEVDVPVLSRAMGTDPHLDYFSTSYLIDGAADENNNGGINAKILGERYLCTSPEFHLKRLVAAGFGSIYSLGHAFRNGESGDRHNPEFTMLEWYRVGMDWNQLMAEVVELVLQLSLIHISPSKQQWLQTPCKKTPWKQAWILYAGIDTDQVQNKDFARICQTQNIPELQNADFRAWLDYLFTALVEPKLGQQGPEFIIDYPPDQAALAIVDQDSQGNLRSRRFELYIQGLELCNGYQELVDAQEQARRFDIDLQERKKMGKRIPPKDQNFLAALEHGMPHCSGVALGVDRLIMWLLDLERISQVMLFPDSRA